MSDRLSIALLSHVASPRIPTGAERSLSLLATALHGRGHRVAVVAPGDWALTASLGSAGIPVTTIATRPCWLTYWERRPAPVVLVKWVRCIWPQRARVALTRFLSGWNPDVVHVNCLPHVVGAHAASRLGRPVVWHLREILPAGQRRRWLAGKLRRHAWAVVAVSEAVARWVRAEGLGDRLHVIPNGVDPPSDPLDAGRARAKLGLDPEGTVVGLFGQLVEHKGALAFIRAARRVSETDAGARFVLAGPGPPGFRRRCEEAIARSGSPERIRILPAQPSSADLLAASDVVCLATTRPDPFPRAVLEAMAAGRPVAAFDSGGTAEMVVNEETGLLVPSGDVEGLARAIVRLVADRSLRESMGEAGSRRAREIFSMDRHVSRMEELFHSIAGRGAVRE